MRIWDVPCSRLTDQHLLGEHVELHTMWNAHARGLTGGYSRHPETLRWSGHLEALRLRHEEQVQEMLVRGFRHNSPLKVMATDDSADWPSVTLPGNVPAEAMLEALTYAQGEACGACGDCLICATLVKAMGNGKG